MPNRAQQICGPEFRFGLGGGIEDASDEGIGKAKVEMHQRAG
jgi:hypothetical protein